ncbi:MAG: B12-binding domain-containing radical SAM protein [Phycisphaerae bacterium]|nr:B12-binding domain-containing radical SAM protein [Phycisphaerae bacterium]
MNICIEESKGTNRRARLRMVSPAYPAFNIYSRLAKETTPLGPVCIATAVNDIPGWDAEVIDENNYRRGPRDRDGHVDHAELQRLRPANVAGLYGGLTSTIPRLLDIAKQYKAMGVRTVAGGQHFVEDNVEHALRNGVDVVVLGEGEKTITELLACFEADGDLEEIHGIAFLKNDELVLTPRREPIRDFDELPIPDFSTLRYAKMIFFPVSGTRGCGMDCEFCSVKGKPRFASPERMLEQFASIYERWGRRIFFIVDDLFGQNRAETIRLCHLLRDYQNRARTRFSITVQIRLDKARDEELLSAMRQAGVNVLAIGFESPIAEELAAMNKHLKPQDMLDLVKRYRKAGFRLHGMFIFGYPAQEGVPFHMPADERVKHFRRFIRKAKIDTVQVLQPIPLPGTVFTARMRAQNRIFSTDLVGLEYYDGNFPIIQPDEPLTPEELQASAYKIMGHFYRPRSLFHVGLNILVFPYVAFGLHRLEATWQTWRRKWTKDLYRAGGWITLRQWASAFRKDGFRHKLAAARDRLSRHSHTPHTDAM